MFRRIVTVFALFVSLVMGKEYTSLNTGVSQPQISVLQADENMTQIRVVFPGFYSQDTVREGLSFQKITMPSMGFTLEAGFPELPQTVRLVGIDNRGSYSVSVLSSDFTEIEGINVFPAQPQPTRLEEKVPWTYNSQAYRQNSWYPASMATTEEAAILRDHRVLPVVIRPVQFNPAAQKIRVAKSITVQIEKSGLSGENEMPDDAAPESKAFQPLYESYILNYRQLQRRRTPGPDGMPSMLIITADGLYDQVLPFAEWKNQKGVLTEIVKLSDIAADPTSTQIQTFIQNYYDTAIDKPDYLLIVGDVQGPYAVPWFTVGPDKSDLPYYLLAGNDILPDISGARISVQTIGEATKIFTKLIRYEKQPYTADPNWFHSSLVINSADFQDPTSGMWAVNHFTNYGYNPIHHLGDDLGNASVANVYSAVNSGVSYIYYIGHGAPTYWVTTGFSTTHIPALANGEMQPVISSIACNNADLDERGDVFAETWLKNSANNGSVGILAFTESCAVYETDTLARGMVRAILSDSVTAFGNIIDYGRLHMFQSFGTGCSEPMHQSILIGEPELQVWTKTPDSLTVNMPPAAFFNIPFTVQVMDSLGAVEGALVCYYDSLGTMARAYTDANGEVVLDPGIAQPVSGTVTVTAHNKLPFQAPLEILPPQGPYVMATDIMAVDTLGNGNQVVEAGEEISFLVELKNIGVDPAGDVSVAVASADSNITITADSVYFGPIAAGDTAVAGSFQAQISAECPHLHAIPIEIRTSEMAGARWSQVRYMMVRKGARIELAQDTVAFPPTFLQFTSQMDYPVTNSGPDTLYITNITSDIPQFSVEPARISVAPFSEKVLHVQFTPDTTELYNGTLTIENSDPLNYLTSFSVTGSGIFAPDIKAEPDSIAVYAAATDSLTKNLRIYNNGLGELEFSAQVGGGLPGGAVAEGTGGADDFGHIWIDSQEPSGPLFDWIDISESGTMLPLTGNNAISNEVPIGFDFNFYGGNYPSLRVCSNGWLSFTTFSVAYNNFALPSMLAPRSMVAPLWDDLMMNAASKVYTDTMENKFVVMYDSLYRVTGEGPYTFEVILYDNGNLKFQYLSLDSLVHDYTVGIQNQAADDGLTVAFNEPYLQDSLAVLISKHSWVKVSPMAGTIAPQEYLDLELTIQTSNFPLGEFYSTVQVESNDPDESLLYVPVHMTVGATALENPAANLPATLQLSQNYPNPFNPVTRIEYALPQKQEVTLSVYNMLGQKVTTLFSGPQNAGIHRVEWNGTNRNGNMVGSGVYIYKLETEKKSITRKMLLLK